MTVWLHIIGLGEGGVPPEAEILCAGAETVLGPRRLLSRLPGVASEKKVAWAAGFASMRAQVSARRGRPTVILATGDPMWFGIGASLADFVPPSEMTIHPAPSAFQFAAARLGWPLDKVVTLSLHGRPVAALHLHLWPGARLLALTGDAPTAREVAALLVKRGYGGSTLTVLENLGGADERITAATAENFDGGIGDFYVLAIDCVAAPGAALLPPVPGLPDEAFLSDGQLTKREVRAATLAKLAPYPGALLWDIGAGCGSVGIEWLRAAPGGTAIAFERAEERAARIAANAENLGAPNLQIEVGDALDRLAACPPPDAVFLGGDVDNEPLFERAWAMLKPGGRFVANAVTIEGEAALFTRQSRLGGELTRLEVAVLTPLGLGRGFSPRRPVTQWLAVKP